MRLLACAIAGLTLLFIATPVASADDPGSEDSPFVLVLTKDSSGWAGKWTTTDRPSKPDHFVRLQFCAAAGTTFTVSVSGAPQTPATETFTCDAGTPMGLVDLQNSVLATLLVDSTAVTMPPAAADPDPVPSTEVCPDNDPITDQEAEVVQAELNLKTRPTTSADYERKKWNQSSVYVLVLGPDGHAIGSAADYLSEKSDIYVVLYKDRDAKYNFQITGCTEASPRVLQSDFKSEGNEPRKHIAEIRHLGRCSAESKVTVSVTACQKAGTAEHSFQTRKAFRWLLSAGIAFGFQDVTSVGVDVGTGGNANTVFERTEKEGFQSRVILGYFPFEMDDDAALDYDRFFIGVAVDAEHPTDSFNLALGYNFAGGLVLFTDLELCRNTEALGGGLQHGDTFTGDSSTVPTEKEWSCDKQRVSIGASISLQAVSSIIGKLGG